jgi:hypothetical protein
VLRPHGTLLIGRSVAPADGLDARMKQQLAAILADRRVAPDTYSYNARDEAERSLAAAAARRAVTAATWTAERSPRRFLERHRTGARFASLPEPVGQEALAALADWATTTFGALEAVVREPHAFELQIFTFATMDPLHA